VRVPLLRMLLRRLGRGIAIAHSPLAAFAGSRALPRPGLLGPHDSGSGEGAAPDIVPAAWVKPWI
jgi:hypothetical protein